MSILQLQQTIDGIDVYEVLDKVLERFKPELLDLNTSQLEKGEASDGSNVGMYVDSEYAKFKKSIGSISSPKVDLKVTGDFYEGFRAEIKKKIISISSKDSKAGNLEKRYGSEIYGLTASNLSVYIDTILPYFIDEMRKEMLK